MKIRNRQLKNWISYGAYLITINMLDLSVNTTCKNPRKTSPGYPTCVLNNTFAVLEGRNLKLCLCVWELVLSRTFASSFLCTIIEKYHARRFYPLFLLLFRTLNIHIEKLFPVNPFAWFLTRWLTHRDGRCLK